MEKIEINLNKYKEEHNVNIENTAVVPKNVPKTVPKNVPRSVENVPKAKNVRYEKEEKKTYPYERTNDRDMTVIRNDKTIITDKTDKFDRNNKVTEKNKIADKDGTVKGTERRDADKSYAERKLLEIENLQAVTATKMVS